MPWPCPESQRPSLYFSHHSLWYYWHLLSRRSAGSHDPSGRTNCTISCTSTVYFSASNWMQSWQPFLSPSTGVGAKFLDVDVLPLELKEVYQMLFLFFFPFVHICVCVCVYLSSTLEGIFQHGSEHWTLKSGPDFPPTRAHMVCQGPEYQSSFA